MPTINDLVTGWREAGPVVWAESPYGWIDVDGKPINLAPWQREVLSTWWIHRKEVTTLGISTTKKAGKTFTNAALTCWRWLALPGVHICAANSFDQAASRSFLMIADMCRRHPYLKTVTKVGVKQIEFTPTGSILKAVSADFAGVAGENFVTSSHTECWAITYEADIRTYEELTPVPGSFYGMPCLRIVDSYAGYIDESETWHKLVDRGLSGKELDPDWGIYQNGGLLLFHLQGAEAQRKCFRGSVTDSELYYNEQRKTLRNNAFMRLHENIRVQNVGNFVDFDAWVDLINHDHKPLQPTKKHSLYVGLDLAVSPGGDNAACIAVYWDEGKVKTAWVKMWKGSMRLKKLQLIDTVYPFLVEKAKQYNINAVYFDPWQGLALAELLQKAGIRTVEVKQSHKNRGDLDTRLFELISNKELVLFNDSDLREASSGASAKELPDGKLFLTKSTGRSKIDLLVALSNCAAYCAGDQSTGRQLEICTDVRLLDWLELNHPEFLDDSPCPFTPGDDCGRCRRRASGCQIAYDFFGVAEREKEERAFYANQPNELMDPRESRFLQQNFAAPWVPPVDPREEHARNVSKLFWNKIERKVKKNV